jgi:hypothetical protein
MTSPDQTATDGLRRSLAGKLSRALTETHLFTRRRLWIWPLIAVLLLAVLGVTVRSIVERSIQQSLAGHLQALLDADETALRLWLRQQTVLAAAIAEDRQVQLVCRDLVDFARTCDADKIRLLQSDQLRQARDAFAPILERFGYFSFGLMDDQLRVVGAMRDEPVGARNLPIQESALKKAMAGEATVVRPFASLFASPDDTRYQQTGVPVMMALAPITDEAGTVSAVLALQILPEDDFTRILSVASAGDTGETYAFDAEGTMLSQSRFDEQLKVIGLLPDKEDARSILNIQIRDPQVNLVNGERSELRMADRPLTRMAASAVAGEAGVDVEGYRDYRGVRVVGAWTWLPEFGFGVATEVDYEEAYAPLRTLQTIFWSLFGTIAASAAVIFGFTLTLARKEQEARRAVLKAKQLGQYALEEKLGEGGMGVVYRGSHAMLRRPTAIKLLHIEQTNPETIARFEREVTLTSQLTHPNTIAIYDFGQTPEGLFYYAMEYLEGLDLDRLVKDFGPQSDARIVHILKQVCGSLAEAHSHGLIHRDIKPGNVFLTQRGGLYDFAKVLDFGLVKAIGAADDGSLTAAGALTGTPLFLAPEQIEHSESVDQRTDLYALGAVAYFLVTGSAPFSGESIVEICMKHVQQTPESPTARAGRPVEPVLEEVILQCLMKNPADRPDSAAAVAEMLSTIDSRWTQAAAEQWWRGRVLSMESRETATLEETVISVPNPTQRSD